MLQIAMIGACLTLVTAAMGYTRLVPPARFFVPILFSATMVLLLLGTLQVAGYFRWAGF